MNILRVLLVIIIAIPFFSFASKPDEKETTVEIKKGGAITAFTKEDGFKLSDKSISNLEVVFSKIKGTGPWVLPKSALVKIKHSTGVYRKWDGWITMVLVTVISQNKATVTIKSQDLENLDEVAISGVPFLRMTEADLNSDTIDACSH